MYRIEYPGFFEQMLILDKGIRSAVDGLVSDFNEWFSISKMPFFQDYTDHGIEHLNLVLETTYELMAPESKKLFTTEDTAILIIGILLHDSAMHLSEAGFFELIKGSASTRCVTDFDSTSWPDLWESFLYRAKRWDSVKLVNIFGGDEKGHPIALVLDPFDRYSNLTEADRKLIGEFIRLHHPRMAHEFALFGIPGAAGNHIQLSEKLPKYMLDISGLIARSHGLPIRRCLLYLNGKYHKREYCRIHVIFIIILLRISDFIQIQANRAPSMTFRYKNIFSKASQIEFKTHNSVQNITQTHDDPESLEIQAVPPDVHIFLRLKEWLEGIQSELDSSWAILGEVYASNVKLQGFGITLRRVRSNLDDQNEFAADVDYVPKRIEFTVKRPDMLKLLIRPLYGNRPEVGIRELLQNAVDAVRERDVFLKSNQINDIKTYGQINDIEIWIRDPGENGHALLTITDKGIGMTEEIISNYFLKAGASYRQSQVWQEIYEDPAARLKSNVLRSGRFGVGVLAAFLLGNEVTVETRHISKDIGYSFTTQLNPQAINIKVVSSLPSGTKISIMISNETYERLKNEKSSWNWFCFPVPTIARYFSNEKKNIGNNLLRLNQNALWREIDHPNYRKIYWTYDRSPGLSVNGLRVRKEKLFPRKMIPKLQYSHNGRRGLILHSPNLSILDSDGILPINLQRNDLTEQVPDFTKNVRESVLKDILSFYWLHAPSSFSASLFSQMPCHPAYRHNSGATLLTQEGLVFADEIFSKKDTFSILVLPDGYGDKDRYPSSSDIRHDFFNTSCLEIPGFVRQLGYGWTRYTDSPLAYFEELNVELIGSRGFCSTYCFDEFINKGTTHLESCVVTPYKNFVEITYGKCPQSLIKNRSMFDKREEGFENSNDCFRMVEYFLKISNPQVPIFTQLLMEYCSTSVIPFRENRPMIESLSDYINLHQQ